MNKFSHFRSTIDLFRKNVKLKDVITRNTMLGVETKRTNESISQISKFRGKKFVYPNLTVDRLINIRTVVGLHLAPSGISWATLYREKNDLIDWDVTEFKELPKKSLPTDIFPLAMSAANKIPEGDVYIFEVPESLNHLNQKPIALNFYTQQLMLSSMITAILNMRENSSSDEDIINNIYYIKSRLPARLFRLLIGTERVSALSTVAEILENSSLPSFSLPCTSVNVENHLKTRYYNQTAVNKDLLGGALMIAMAFMDLCVYKNAKSISEVTKTKR